VLAAEKEAGVSAARVRLTVTWSFAMRKSIDGKVEGPGIYGFQDMVAVLDDPKVAHYTPRSSLEELQEAFKTRWVHGLNTQSPWNFVRDLVSKEYSKFAPIPWFIGEYGGSGQDEDMIQGNLLSMQNYAEGSDVFLGAAFLQFQVAYWKGGAGMNFGLFGLGDEVIGETGVVCELGCRKWPVHCLTTTKDRRAQAVASAWGGSIDHSSLCAADRRLGAAKLGTKLACQLRAGSGVEAPGAVAAALGTDAFGKIISDRTRVLLDDASNALVGELSLTRTTAWSSGFAPAAGSDAELGRSWLFWGGLVGVAALISGGVCVVLKGREDRKSPAGSAAEQSV